jgi:hypothetical protein
MALVRKTSSYGGLSGLFTCGQELPGDGDSFLDKVGVRCDSCFASEGTDKLKRAYTHHHSQLRD